MVCPDIITFKEGSLPAVWQEYQALKALAPKDVLVVERKGCRQTFRWVNDIDFDGLTVNAFECLEETAAGATLFVWLTGLRVTAATVVELAEGGRRRWKIENEGFNAQKNGGYELEHAYSTDATGPEHRFPRADSTGPAGRRTDWPRPHDGTPRPAIRQGCDGAPRP